MNASVEQLVSLQAKPEKIRNVCILAHVDHGKTTMSDHLIGSNGLIHPRLMGELRFLDSRDDEQARGITMKSSSISLLYVPGAQYLPEGPQSCTTEQKLREGYLINLIDSPGHVDFCSEVSTAVRLSDGGIVVVDAVEGVCIQTHAVLRQAWQEKVKLCLVINKVDRLIQELHLTPMEAYERLRTIVAHANMVVSSFQSEQFLSDADAVLANEAALASGAASSRQDAVDTSLDEDEEPVFEPEKGTVAFASAMDGWGFQIHHFAKLYAAKMGCNASALTQAMWGDFAFNAKTKRIVRIKAEQQGKLTPLFVQLALDPIWKAYEACTPGADTQAILTKIVKALQLTQVPAKAVAHSDAKAALKAVMRSWLPLSEAVLNMVAQHLPDPAAAIPDRMERLMPSRAAQLQHSGAGLSPQALQDLERIESGMQACTSAADAPTVVCISKMVAVPQGALPQRVTAANPSGTVFVGFGRVFCGTVHEGDVVHVLSAAYNPKRPHMHRQEVKVTGLYMMMGRALEKVAQVPAGCVLAVGGLDQVILKSATLSSTPHCFPLAPMLFQAAPIVRVALEPVKPEEMGKLQEGLRLLNRADPFVQVALADSGEHVLGAAGEVHLEMCVKDLQERFAGVQLHVSEPLVAFKESVFDRGDAAYRPGKIVEIDVIDEAGILQPHQANGNGSNGFVEEDPSEALEAAGGIQSVDSLQQLQARIRRALDDCGPDARALLQRSWLFGPNRTGPNLLCCGDGSKLWDAQGDSVAYLNRRPQAGDAETAPAGIESTEDSPVAHVPDHSLSVPLGPRTAARVLGVADDSHSAESASYDLDQLENGATSWQHSIESGVVAGFQLAASAGPLCDEPLWGVAFQVAATYRKQQQAEADRVYGPLSGQVTSVMRQAVRRAVLEAGPCLVEAMSLCEVSATSDALAGVFAVLRQRRARVVSDEMREGSGLFSVLAHLPVQSSFGFVDDMRRKSSGAASASLMLSHWERLQVDPFFVPKTEEEREDFGEEGQGMGGKNLARILIDQVRRRKGLALDHKVVESATKQRTRARKV
ncbi:hypothetical protein WJX73_002877 [Symbiochloris irregularis]|uniref:Tr-type G domain-containing protein n=1 Tax=Symbiochloris irregularis TaxID=706552 RepID=A0AAW1NTT5_9CHLO